MRLLACLTMASLACATVPQPPAPIFISETRRPEERALPPDPRAEALPPEFAGEEWMEPAEPQQVVSKPGLLVSESRVARDILFRTRYDELRSLYGADRDVWRVQRRYYEERLAGADIAIKSLQPTWWDLNKGSVCLWGGLLLGVGLTVGVTSAVSGVTK